MNSIVIINLLSLVILFLIVFLTVRVHKNLIIRTILVFFFLLVNVVAFAAYSSFLGQPKPVNLEFIVSNKEMTLLSVHMKKGEMIWLWVKHPDYIQPLYYGIPWSEKLAKEITKKQMKSKATGQPIKINGLLSKRYQKNFSQLNLNIVVPPKPPEKQIPRNTNPFEYNPGISHGP